MHTKFKVETQSSFQTPAAVKKVLTESGMQHNFSVWTHEQSTQLHHILNSWEQLEEAKPVWGSLFIPEEHGWSPHNPASPHHVDSDLLSNRPSRKPCAFPDSALQNPGAEEGHKCSDFRTKCPRS
jgi:hypothetical protein